MLKNNWKVVAIGLIFLTEVLLSSARAVNWIREMDYESKTQDTQYFQNQISPNPIQIQSEGQRTSMIRETSKIKSNPSPDRILEEIRQTEYNEIRYNEESTDYYGFIQGTIPILISAPHGAKHFRRRENRWKGEDEYTASLAIELGRMTGAYVIYVKNKTNEDPNNDPSSRYKMAVSKAVKQYHIKFLLDIHGSDAGRPYKVDIGIISNESGKGSCPNFREIIQEVFSDFEPKIFNKKFCANDVCTMTSFAKNKLGIEAAQVEINARYRIVERKPDSSKARAGIEPHFRANGKDVLDMVANLERMILGIDQKIKECTLANSSVNEKFDARQQ